MHFTLELCTMNRLIPGDNLESVETVRLKVNGVIKKL